MELSLPPSPAASARSASGRRAGVLPVIVAALVSPTDDARGFRRYPAALEVGVRLDSAWAPCRGGHSRHAALAGDLSLTGLYLVTALPYRVGTRLEVSVPLPGRVLVHLPGVVCRLDAPARTPLGALETAFGCGVDFRQRETSAQARRALMEFLVRRTVPA